MKSKKKGCVLLFISVIILLAGMAPERFVDKTLTRVDDPVVMECSRFTRLLGSAMDSLTLMAHSDGRWAPVPFQLDQRKPNGDYAFVSGPEAGVDPDPNLDANDEMVFMAKDSGDRVLGEKKPDGADEIMEIEIIDPKNGNKGWLYLARFPGAAPRSDIDYIRIEIDEAKRYRRVISYEYIVGGPIDRVYPDYIAARELPDGSEGLDVLDRLKIRGTMKLAGGFTVPIKADEMIRSKDKAYTDGPIRVLHLTEGYMDFQGIKFRGTGYSTVFYYPNHVIVPVTMDASSALARFLMKAVSEVSINGYMDFNSNVYGSYVFDGANPHNPGIILDGRMSEAERNMDTNTPIEWVAGFGPQGAIIARLTISGEGVHAKKYTYYVDDKKINDPPEDSDGLSGVGFNVRGSGRDGIGITSGTICIYIYYKRQLEPNQVKDILDILDHPLRTEVRDFK